MKSGFFPTVSDRDPRGGLLVLSELPAALTTSKSTDIQVTATFPILTVDPESTRTKKSLRGAPIDFSYRVHGFQYEAVMNELANALVELHTAHSSAFQQSCSAFMSDGHVEHEQLSLALHPLAELGHNLYIKLFQLSDTPDYHSDDQPRDKFSELGRLLRGWLEMAEDIQIVAPRHLIPWSILYPHYPEQQTVEPRHFWGYAKNLQVMDKGLSRAASLRGEWRIAIAVEEEDEALRAGTDLHAEVQHPFVRMADRVTSSRCPVELFSAFAQADILYHFGHYSGSSRGFAFGAIKLNGTGLNASKLESLLAANRITLPPTEPLLVFLNGCGTAVGADRGDNLADVLVKYGLGRFCFIATLGAVPPWPAAMFASKFFRACLGQEGSRTESVGSSIRKARLEMLEEYGSPIGLLYLVYGKIAIAIDQSPNVALAHLEGQS